MPTNPKFSYAKDQLITAAQRVAGAYLLSKYGSAHIAGEPKVELTASNGPTDSSFIFNGTITCYAAGDLLNQVGVNMTINENDVEVTSEDVVAKVTNALNAQEEHSEHVVAALDSFKLTDDGSKYLKVSHSALQDANLGLVGKNEWVASPDKSELLQSIVKDAMLETPVSFTGEFKEPIIEKIAEYQPKTGEPCSCRKGMERDNCPACEGTGMKVDFKKIREASKKEASMDVKASWLTAGFDGDTFECDNCHNGNCAECQFSEGCDCTHAPKTMKPMGIAENMPMANMSDSMAQMAQLESQLISASEEKIKTQAANSLISMLHGMGYGSAKIAEVTSSTEGFDFMAAIDDAGAVKAVSIPVVIKDAQVILPKKSLISTLISKGLDVRAKLSEQFDFDVLEKLAAIDEKMAYEAKEANDILNEKPVVKTAGDNGFNSPGFMSAQDSITLQKHLLPAGEWKKGDVVYADNQYWKLSDMNSDQNSKGEDDASLYHFVKCEAPKSDDKVTNVKV